MQGTDYSAIANYLSGSGTETRCNPDNRVGHASYRYDSLINRMVWGAEPGALRCIIAEGIALEVDDALIESVESQQSEVANQTWMKADRRLRNVNALQEILDILQQHKLTHATPQLK